MGDADQLGVVQRFPGSKTILVQVVFQCTKFGRRAGDHDLEKSANRIGVRNAYFGAGGRAAQDRCAREGGGQSFGQLVNPGFDQLDRFLLSPLGDVFTVLITGNVFSRWITWFAHRCMMHEIFMEGWR